MRLKQDDHQAVARKQALAEGVWVDFGTSHRKWSSDYSMPCAAAYTVPMVDLQMAQNRARRRGHGNAVPPRSLRWTQRADEDQELDTSTLCPPEQKRSLDSSGCITGKRCMCK
jgi:hypothetical protein